VQVLLIRSVENQLAQSVSYRRAFCFAHGVSHYLLDQVSKGMANPKFAFHTGRTATTLERPKLSMDEMKEMAKKYGVAMSENQSRMATMPDSPEAYICNLWMRDYFNKCGDHIPNSDGEVLYRYFLWLAYLILFLLCQIHLDWIEKKTIHETYCADMDIDFPTYPAYSYFRFIDMWKHLYPKVTIRVYKAVTGGAVSHFACVCSDLID